LAADPKVLFSRTLNSVAGNARLAADDITTEVGTSFSHLRGGC
jgi:hypothetical protein